MMKNADLAAQSVSPLHHSNGQSVYQLLSSAVIYLRNAAKVKAWRHLQAQHPCVKTPFDVLL